LDFDAISVYTHMALINPSPGVIDFNDYRTLEPLYETAKQTGVWIVLRPGMGSLEFGGVCANEHQDLTFIRRRLLEVSHWITSQVAGELRTNARDWQTAWQDYVKNDITETAPYQVSEGGPVMGKSGLDTLFDYFCPVRGCLF
jgi:hypothetical protein